MGSFLRSRNESFSNSCWYLFLLQTTPHVHAVYPYADFQLRIKLNVMGSSSDSGHPEGNWKRMSRTL
jgi:hypothetical protein